MQTDTGRWIKWLSDITSVVFKPLPSNLSRCLLSVDVAEPDLVHLEPSKLNRQENVHFFCVILCCFTHSKHFGYTTLHTSFLFVIHHLNTSLITLPEPVWSWNTLSERLLVESVVFTSINQMTSVSLLKAHHHWVSLNNNDQVFFAVAFCFD